MKKEKESKLKQVMNGLGEYLSANYSIRYNLITQQCEFRPSSRAGVIPPWTNVSSTASLSKPSSKALIAWTVTCAGIWVLRGCVRCRLLGVSEMW